MPQRSSMRRTHASLYTGTEICPAITIKKKKYIEQCKNEKKSESDAVFLLINRHLIVYYPWHMAR